MKEKKTILNYIFMCCVIILTLSGITRINIINTKALSPLGNTNENYKMVSKEFGEDFSKFIKDNSILKIYKEKDNILIRIGENNFVISNNNLNRLLNNKNQLLNSETEDS